MTKRVEKGSPLDLDPLRVCIRAGYLLMACTIWVAFASCLA